MVRYAIAGTVHKFAYITRKRQRKHFFLNEPLEYVVMDILGPISKTKQGDTSFVDLIERHAKLTTAISTPKPNTTTVDRIFLLH